MTRGARSFTSTNDQLLSLDTIALIRRLFPIQKDFLKVVPLGITEPTFNKAIQHTYISANTLDEIEQGMLSLEWLLGPLWPGIETLYFITPEEFAQHFDSQDSLPPDKWQLIQANYKRQRAIQKIIEDKRQEWISINRFEPVKRDGKQRNQWNR